ncbi:MAG TPA: hypothetical protein VHY56_11220 [Candidatus Binataceae bacterium]|nr:hypothetical protein [Candidatus Binataceae bacterium]
MRSHSAIITGTIVLALALGACRRTTALTCPSGATMMGAAPPHGDEVWCQKIVDGKPVKDGPFIVYGEGADRLIQGSYRNGIQEGEWTTWYANGQRSAVDHFHKGLQDGLHTSWYFNGVKSIEGEYHMGKREGVWTSWDPTGYTSKQETYRGDRKIR